MNPFFFGSSQEPLFGVYHPPHSDSGRLTGVVLCYPMGQEYMRAHRAFRQLALLLSRAGFHVMRFDYFATGDSAGDAEEATIERWIEDIGVAIDELKDTADVEEVAVVGLRLGGTLAAHAVSGRDDVTHVVLWDPVVDGRAYLEHELEIGGAAGLSGNGSDAGARFANASVRTGSRSSATGTVGVNGFPLSAKLQKSLGELQLSAAPLNSAAERFVVVSSEISGTEGFAAELKRNTNRNSYECVPSEGNWNEVDDFGSALIPQAIIRTIVNHLSERADA